MNEKWKCKKNTHGFGNSFSETQNSVETRLTGMSFRNEFRDRSCRRTLVRRNSKLETHIKIRLRPTLRPVLWLRKPWFFETMVFQKNIVFSSYDLEKPWKQSNLHSLRMQVKTMVFSMVFQNHGFFHPMTGRQTLLFFILLLFFSLLLSKRQHGTRGKEFAISQNEHNHYYLLPQTTSGNNVCYINIIY